MLFHSSSSFICSCALFAAESRTAWDSSGQIAYEKACKKYGVIVSSSFYNKLKDANAIDLGHYGVGVAGAKAIAVAFCVSKIFILVSYWNTLFICNYCAM